MRTTLLSLSLGQGCTWIPLDGPLGGPKGGKDCESEESSSGDIDCDSDTGDFEDGVVSSGDCDDTDLLHAVRTGNVSSEEVLGFCEGYCQRAIFGDLSISDTTLTDLTALSCLTEVSGSVAIGDNVSLTSLSGLENLTVDGSLSILNNALTSLSGLENLTTVGGSLSIWDNNALTSLSGLENLTTVSAGLDIYNNDALTSLSGLESLTTIGTDLRIHFNASLTSLSDLEELTTVGGSLGILHNTQLCEDEGDALLEQLESFSGYVYIEGNTGVCP